jgi:hypothetical protein
VTALLPSSVQAVFDRFITTEFTTVDAHGQPITWPLTPYYSLGAPSIEVTTGIGYPKKADDARANPLVALLFSDPTGSGLHGAPAVLVQGTATVNDADLEANRDRYARESAIKLPALARRQPPVRVQRLFGWYFLRLWIRVRPERVYVWPSRECRGEPELYDAHMEEVRSGHSEEPERFHAAPEGGSTAWDARIDELGTRYPTAVLSIVTPDGFPFAARVPVRVDHAARAIRIDADPDAMPLAPGLACLTAHTHSDNFTWMQNFQVRGDLVRDGQGWTLHPHKLVGGLEIPKNRLEVLRSNAAKVRRFHRTAKRELARRA